MTKDLANGCGRASCLGSTIQASQIQCLSSSKCTRKPFQFQDRVNLMWFHSCLAGSLCMPRTLQAGAESLACSGRNSTRSTDQTLEGSSQWNYCHTTHYSWTAQFLELLGQLGWDHRDCQMIPGFCSLYWGNQGGRPALSQHVANLRQGRGP